MNNTVLITIIPVILNIENWKINLRAIFISNYLKLNKSFVFKVKFMP